MIRSVPVLLACAAALLGAAGASADDPASLRGEADRLEGENAELADRERSAVLDLYALQTRLARASRWVEALEAAAEEVERKRASAEERLALVRANLSEAQRQLAERLRALYVEGDPDPLAVLLGAGSLDETLTALDSLGRFAHHDRRIVEQVSGARATVKQALDALAEEQAELAALTAEAEAARDAASTARAERAGYLAGLREQQRLNDSEIAALTADARDAEARTAELEQPSSSGGSSAPGGTPPPPASPPPTGGRKLTVEATAYAIHGTTATGIQTTWGVVAVDPTVIPLGTRMTIPGYGEGVAADTGSAVKGLIIDVWFPTREQAIQWGRRTVTITLH